VTSSQSDTESTTLSGYADEVAAVVGGTGEVTFDTVKVTVESAHWEAAHRTARDELGLVFFSWLSAVDWTNEVAVGDPPGEEVEERLEVLSTVSDISEGRRVTFTTSIPNESPAIASLVGVYAGANWHEREAHEMFGIDFEGHPDLSHLYLPDSFVGHPLRKQYPLLSREVKPWPGTVDVEPMPEGPSEENPES
jgi:NADH:ubiquinone oxidoreductase subunit C